ncbi:hypothetical protein JB92DRAFT_1034656 [Gautieria morchelliformis]|nr:hypothetical protein JB92DRAFT_1034656 [Gautieria morchelliformis]
MALNLPKLAAVLLTAKSSLVAALTYLSYDHVITFDTEITYVWKTPWSLGKGLFIFVNVTFSLR